VAHAVWAQDVDLELSWQNTRVAQTPQEQPPSLELSSHNNKKDPNYTPIHPPISQYAQRNYQYPGWTVRKCSRIVFLANALWVNHSPILLDLVLVSDKEICAR
jgi:hypothetical protein